jgi:hypothetical protein
MKPRSVVGAFAGCAVVMALAAPAATATADRPGRQVAPQAQAVNNTDPLDVSTPPHSSDAYVLASRDTKLTQTTYISRRHHGHWSTLPGSRIKFLTRSQPARLSTSASTTWLRSPPIRSGSVGAAGSKVP